MRGPRLRHLRIAGAAVVMAALTAALVDFRGAVPAPVGHAAATVQFAPSAVALLTGAALSVACLVILGVTLALGRVYCSVICPLGILQDIAVRMASVLRRRSAVRPYRAPMTWLRQACLWGSVLGVIAGGAGLTLSLLDPYSLYGRIASDLFRPTAAALNNALVGPLGSETLYRVPPPWPAVPVMALALAVLLLIAGLAAWRGRIYCNTVCPVGTLLGMVAARGALRLTLDPAACQKCGDCLRGCKAQCIDLRAGKIDASRCVACYNCLSACDRHGIGYRWWWRRTAQKPVRTAPADPHRRAFLATAAVTLTTAASAGRLLGAVPAADPERRSSNAICPPGAEGVERFLDRCTACHLCVSACPTHVLQPAVLDYGVAGLLKPRLDYAAAFCNFDCRRCAEVCPDGALTLLPLAEKQVTRIAVADLEVDRCIVKTKGTDCAACSEHCPTKAVDTVPYGDNLRLPQVNRDLCIGCGACEFACPAQPRKAIAVTGLARHERATRRVEEKAGDPRKGEPFPF